MTVQNTNEIFIICGGGLYEDVDFYKETSKLSEVDIFKKEYFNLGTFLLNESKKNPKEVFQVYCVNNFLRTNIYIFDGFNYKKYRYYSGEVKKCSDFSPQDIEILTHFNNDELYEKFIDSEEE